jgi:hypothetical protein
MRITNAKIVISGAVVEVYTFDHPLGYDYEAKRPSSPPKRDPNDEKEKARKNDVRLRSGHRARNHVRRLIPANAGHWLDDYLEPIPVQFGTLTFKENITDLKTANHEFTDFIKRLNYELFETKLSRLRYIAVPEFQKRGAVHFHIVFFNLPEHVAKSERRNRRIANTWGNGFVDFKPVNDIEHAANYISKYMAKNFDEPRLDGKKKYFCSKGLKRPSVIRDQGRANAVIEDLSAEITKYEKDFDSPLLGKTHYKKYILTSERLETLKDFIFALHYEQLPCNTLSTVENLQNLKIDRFSPLTLRSESF